MTALTTDRDGRLRFAAISRTKLGATTQRLRELRWFYDRLPGRGVDTVVHLGNVIQQPLRDLPALYPRVEGVRTLEVVNGFLPAASTLMIDGGREDWDPCDGLFQLIHGATGARARLLCFYDWFNRHSLGSRVRDREAQLGDADPAEIILVGGYRKFECRYFHHDHAFIGTVGVFDSRVNHKNPPAVFGGTIVDLMLDEAGALVSCALTFRDLSGRMPDF